MAQFMASKTKEISNREKIHQQRVREAAPEGMVLLENDGVLPLGDESKTIALYGTGARKTVKGGTGSGDVNSRTVVNIEQGLLNAGIQITTTDWLDTYDKREKEAFASYITNGKQELANGMDIIQLIFEHPYKLPDPQLVTEEDVKASDTDTAVYVISRNSGEGADRFDAPGDFMLSDAERENLVFLGRHFAKLVVLLNIGGALDTRELRAIPGIGAVLLVSQAGNISGDAIADVLYGVTYPSGKLTTTWAENCADYPLNEEFSHNNGNIDDSYYKEGIYVGYRYFDSFGKTPAYCFGYGMGYTTFQIFNETVTADEKTVTVEATVTNTGNRYAGRETLQVYYSAPQGVLDKPYQELAGYAKTKELEPGESERVTVTFATEQMASYNEKTAAYLLEAGDYYIRVGSSSRNTNIAACLKLDADAIVEQDQNLFALDAEVEEIKADPELFYTYLEEQEEKQAAPVIVLNTEAFSCRTTGYQDKPAMIAANKDTHVITLTEVKEGKATLDELIGQLTERELAMLCVGSGWENEESSGAVIGSASLSAPGAAGETTASMLESRDIRNTILADGPAGLRLEKEFGTDADGGLISGGIAIPIISDLLDINEGNPLENAAERYYQYCTAIPIATMLAQTWNLELIEEMGDIVGNEMEEFGITLWLAPGMNIHRNPLCGRNFEYYSEDPLVAGRCAAADTKGVQKHKGTGTTIKHFACNNQEDNRNFTNSHVKERALREIYLKGFEICVKEASPLSVMTSYNLINGIHAANNRDLLQHVLRDEWGFDGLVMTDWGTTGSIFPGEKGDPAIGKAYPTSDPAACIMAGNDLVMPGIKRDVDVILKSINAQEDTVICPITLAELQACAKNVLNMIMKSNRY